MMSNAWSLYVMALVTINIVGCVWILWWTSRRRPGDPKPDDTGHIWDGDITEYNKPLPKWWINTFYLAIIFAIGYLVWYPGMGSFAGVGKWTSASEHDIARARNNAILEKTFSAYVGQPIDHLAHDPKALALGRSIFANTCAPCHGSAATGAAGFPNLTDTVWNWGGEPDRILETVLYGREGVMPPLGTVLEAMGGELAVDQMVAYVRALRSPDPDAVLSADELAEGGKTLYQGLCIACHEANAKGNQLLGAPDLTQPNPLYPNTVASIRQTIVEGRHGTMPSWRGLLGETRSRLAAAYVWSLSNLNNAESASAQ